MITSYKSLFTALSAEQQMFILANPSIFDVSSTAELEGNEKVNVVLLGFDQAVQHIINYQTLDGLCPTYESYEDSWLYEQPFVRILSSVDSKDMAEIFLEHLSYYKTILKGTATQTDLVSFNDVTKEIDLEATKVAIRIVNKQEGPEYFLQKDIKLLLETEAKCCIYSLVNLAVRFNLEFSIEDVAKYLPAWVLERIERNQNKNGNQNRKKKVHFESNRIAGNDKSETAILSIPARLIDKEKHIDVFENIHKLLSQRGDEWMKYISNEDKDLVDVIYKAKYITLSRFFRDWRNLNAAMMELLLAAFTHIDWIEPIFKWSYNLEPANRFLKLSFIQITANLGDTDILYKWIYTAISIKWQLKALFEEKRYSDELFTEALRSLVARHAKLYESQFLDVYKDSQEWKSLVHNYLIDYNPDFDQYLTNIIIIVDLLKVEQNQLKTYLEFLSTLS